MKPIPQISFKKQPSEVPGFELLSLQQLFAQAPTFEQHDPFQAHRLSFFAILILEKGKVRHRVDFQAHGLRSGDSLIISKGQVHAFDPKATYEGHLVIFTEAFLLTYFSQPTINKISRLYNYHLGTGIYHHPQANKTFLQALQPILQAPQAFAKTDLIAAHLAIYLLSLEQSRPQDPADPAKSRAHTLFTAFKAEVEKDYPKSRNAEDYARKLAISYKHLNEVCKQFTQKTAKVFIDAYVTLEIKRYLATTHLSAKEISYATGFDEPTNFHKYFRKHSGITPAAFRAQYQKG